MKNLFVVIFFLFFNNVFSQYLELKKKNIEVTDLHLCISSGSKHVVNWDKEVIGVSFVKLDNDSISVFYQFMNEEYLDLSLKKVIKKVSLENFNTIIKEINLLDYELINNSYDSNIFDGYQYKLKMSSNDGYSLEIKTNSPQFATIERGLQKYLDICNKIWEYSKQN